MALSDPESRRCSITCAFAEPKRAAKAGTGVAEEFGGSAGWQPRASPESFLRYREEGLRPPAPVSGGCFHRQTGFRVPL